eukprot:CAMPEP_0118866902 /NCGR_PEP_ID=MMETSP1163-20130328/10674_1 /TAXON_ID=124430 /ORGANISM="Phaeomonas parva, Strain CCMP2877" /LENGTH=315 /DNA_ID=CAMNT_0006801265 /DNA_START=62 /DNA_END=1009 /DNA_ORIENTATION=+
MPSCGPVTVALLALLPVALRFLVAREYPVNPSGAVLITGASSGIGLDAALALDDLGYTVYAGVRKDKDAAALKAQRASLRPIHLEVTDDEQVAAAAERIAAETTAEGMPFVGLVNNAGISRRLPVELEDLDGVKWLFEVNLFGVFRVTQAFIPLLRKSTGRIVNIGSVANILPHPGSSAYSASKAALKSVTDVLRLELSKFDMSVSIVEPGYVKTNIASKVTGENAPWRKADHDKLHLYQPWVDKYEKGRAKSELKASTTEVTNDAIVHALTNARPQTRYVVANVNAMPAQGVKFLADVLPDRLQDALKLMIMPV